MSGGPKGGPALPRSRPQAAGRQRPKVPAQAGTQSISGQDGQRWNLNLYMAPIFAPIVKASDVPAHLNGHGGGWQEIPGAHSLQFYKPLLNAPLPPQIHLGHPQRPSPSPCPCSLALPVAPTLELAGPIPAPPPPAPASSHPTTVLSRPLGRVPCSSEVSAASSSLPSPRWGSARYVPSAHWQSPRNARRPRGWHLTSPYTAQQFYKTGASTSP